MGLPTIYFVQVDRPDGPVKIGYTGRRVGARMAEGQTFSPLELEVLVEAYGTYEDEAHLHRIFKPYHIRGEWFTPGPMLRELLDHLLFDGGDLQLWLESHAHDGIRPLLLGGCGESDQHSGDDPFRGHHRTDGPSDVPLRPGDG